MRDYILTQAIAAESAVPFASLRRAYANWKRRRRLRGIEDLDDRLLADIGVSRSDLESVVNLPLAVDPIAELHRRSRHKS
jgi:uncharacterized protein YjiS (DUF1127 family)